MWLEVLYLLRLFENFSFYIRLIKDTTKDIRYFLFVYLIILGMFTAALVTLNFNRVGDDSIYPVGYDNEMADAYIYHYLLSLGEFQTDTFGEGVEGRVLWIFFCLSIFITSVIILNMMITIMGDTHGALSEKRA